MENHPESTARQYALSEKAMALGWNRNQFNIFYWTDALTTLLHQANRSCAVHYDARDLSRVYVKDRQKEWIEVPYRTKSHIPVTLDEQRWASRKLRAANRVVNERNHSVYAASASV